MAKRKAKKSRKRKEILKAQKKSQGRKAYSAPKNNPPKVETHTKKKSEYELPINIIKKDLLKTGVFLLAALVLLFVLHFGGFSYNEAVNLLK